MDDLLLAEFHQAGIYLPEELEAIEVQRKQAAMFNAGHYPGKVYWVACSEDHLRAQFAQQMQGMSPKDRFEHEKAMGFPSQNLFAQQLFRGPQPTERNALQGIGSLIGGLFGGRFL